MLPPPLASVADLTRSLENVGYLPGDGLVAAVFLAVRLNRPLFLEGDPGVGKTALAQAMAEVLGADLVRLQCYGGIDTSQALYDWNFPRQILHLRAATDIADPATMVDSLYSRDFLIQRPILRAIEHGPSVLLIDEIDRADDDFEALLLEVLEGNAVSIPELGTVRGAEPPLIVLTSNRTREVHDALKRRCLYHWIAHPDVTREAEILRRRVADLPEPLAHDIATAMARLRAADLVKTPGVAESLDLARAVLELRGSGLTPQVVDAALGTVAKHHDDQATVRRELLAGQGRDVGS